MPSHTASVCTTSFLGGGPDDSIPASSAALLSIHGSQSGAGLLVPSVGGVTVPGEWLVLRLPCCSHHSPQSSPSRLLLQAPQEVEAVDAVLPSTYQRTAVQGPSPTVGKLWVEMAAGQRVGHSAQILEDPRGALGSRGMNSAALSPASRLENSSYE